MSYWAWDSSLEIGIPVIDSQHRRIVDYINELNTAISTHSETEVGRILSELVEYTVTHFAFEEQLMEQGGYTYIKTHKKVHENFTHRIENYQERYRAGEDVSRKLLNDLKIWLTNHIQRDDTDYAPFVRKNASSTWISKTLKRFFH